MSKYFGFVFSQGWRWNRFDIGIGVEFYGRGGDAWLCLGFWWIGIEIWRKP